MDSTARDLFQVLSVSLAVSLCSLAEKVGTSPTESFISILHDKKFNIKTFMNHIPDLDARRTVSRDLVKQWKKWNM